MNYTVHYKEGNSEYFENYNIEIRGADMRLYQLDNYFYETNAVHVNVNDVLYIEPEGTADAEL